MTSKSIFSETHIAAYEARTQRSGNWKGYVWMRRQGEQPHGDADVMTEDYTTEDEALFAAELIARDRLREQALD